MVLKLRPLVTVAGVSQISRGVRMAECLRNKKEKKKKNEILAKNANVTKTTTQQSCTGLLYHPTVLFFSFIWSFSPK